MLTVKAKDVGGCCYTNADGVAVYCAIANGFGRGRRVVVDFTAVDCVSSSFVNSAFVRAAEEYGLEYVKDNLSFVNSKKSINKMIKWQITQEVNP